MISEQGLKDFFNNDGTPNWELYWANFQKAYPDDWSYTEMADSQRKQIPSSRHDLRFVDYEYVKEGFLTAGEGFYLWGDFGFSQSGCPIHFGNLFGRGLYFTSEEDARIVKKLIDNWRDDPIERIVKGFDNWENVIIEKISREQPII